MFDCPTFKANIVVIYNIKENCVLLVGYITRLSIFDTNVVGSGLAWRLVTSGGYQEVLAIVTRPSCCRWPVLVTHKHEPRAPLCQARNSDEEWVEVDLWPRSLV